MKPVKGHSMVGNTSVLVSSVDDGDSGNVFQDHAGINHGDGSSEVSGRWTMDLVARSKTHLGSSTRRPIGTKPKGTQVEEWTMQPPIATALHPAPEGDSLPASSAAIPDTASSHLDWSSATDNQAPPRVVMSTIGFGIDSGHSFSWDATEAALRALRDAMERSTLRFLPTPPRSHLQIHVKLGVPPKVDARQMEPMSVDLTRLTAILPRSIPLLPIDVVIGGLYVSRLDSVDLTICTAVACVTIQSVPDATGPTPPVVNHSPWANLDPEQPQPQQPNPHPQPSYMQQEMNGNTGSYQANSMEMLARISEEVREKRLSGGLSQAITDMITHQDSGFPNKFDQPAEENMSVESRSLASFKHKKRRRPDGAAPINKHPLVHRENHDYSHEQTYNGDYPVGDDTTSDYRHLAERPKTAKIKKRPISRRDRSHDQADNADRHAGEDMLAESPSSASLKYHDRTEVAVKADGRQIVRRHHYTHFHDQSDSVDGPAGDDVSDDKERSRKAKGTIRHQIVYRDNNDFAQYQTDDIERSAGDDVSIDSQRVVSLTRGKKRTSTGSLSEGNKRQTLHHDYEQSNDQTDSIDRPSGDDFSNESRSSGLLRRYKKRPPGVTAKNNTRQFVRHDYHDHSYEEPTMFDEEPALGKTAQNLPFPVKLHDALSEVEGDGNDHIISWMPHGRAFKIHKQKEFLDLILPSYFAATKKDSFLRQLNLYGFNRFCAGPDKSAYYHELFLRGMRFLSRRMSRQKVNGNGIRSAGNPDTEPDFYSMPVVPHDAEYTSTPQDASTDVSRDVSDEEMAKEEVYGNEVPSGSPNQVSFPLKLQTMLDKLEADVDNDIISWLPHGRGFLVHQPEAFVKGLMPKFFRQTKFPSFQRQLHMYSFQRITTGKDKGGYYHELFLRGMPHLCQQMVRTRINGKGCRKPSNPDAEPDFYSMQPVAPITPGTIIEIPTELPPNPATLILSRDAKVMKRMDETESS